MLFSDLKWTYPGQGVWHNVKSPRWGGRPLKRHALIRGAYDSDNELTVYELMTGEFFIYEYGVDDPSPELADRTITSLEVQAHLFAVFGAPNHDTTEVTDGRSVEP